MSTKTPTVSFHTLPHADGSATYSHCGYTIIGSVNGPLEPQRRDELPEEAFVEVHIRPATGSGGLGDRALETLIRRTLLSIIQTTHHPRSLIQITLQTLSTPTATTSAAPPHQSGTIIPSLPHLLHTAVLALLAANIPLRTTCTAVLVAASTKGDNGGADFVVEPQEEVINAAKSCHVFAFGATDVKKLGTTHNGDHVQKTNGTVPAQDEESELLLVESQGVFDEETWERAARLAEGRCRGVGGLQEWLRGVVGDMVASAGRWRG